MACGRTKNKEEGLQKQIKDMIWVNIHNYRKGGLNIVWHPLALPQLTNKNTCMIWVPSPTSPLWQGLYALQNNSWENTHIFSHLFVLLSHNIELLTITRCSMEKNKLSLSLSCYIYIYNILLYYCWRMSSLCWC